MMNPLKTLVASLVALSGIAMPVFATEDTWITDKALIKENNFHRANQEEIKGIIERVKPGEMIRYSFKDEDLKWWIYKGDIEVKGNLCNTNLLIVDGNLTIHGSYEDYQCGSGVGALVVMGDVTAQHFLSEGTAHINGTLNAAGLMYANYNDFTFSAEKVNAVGIIVNDKTASYQKGKTDFVLDSNGSYDEGEGDAIRYLVPDAFDFDGNPSWPSYENVFALIKQGKPLFRDKLAPKSLIKKIELLPGEDEKPDEKALLALVGDDIFLDRLLAGWPNLPKTIYRKLQNSGDPITQRMASKSLGEASVAADGVSVLSADQAIGLAESESMSIETMSMLAEHKDMRVRLTLLKREDLPLTLLKKMSSDQTIEVQRALFGDYDHMRRLSSEDLAFFYLSEDEIVRKNIAQYGALDEKQIQKLFADASDEVRLALAQSLSRQRIFEQPSALTSEKIETIAQTMFSAKNTKQKEMTAALFYALSGKAQIAILQEGKTGQPFDRYRLKELPQVETMRYIIEQAPKDHETLAKNIGLPEDLQQMLFQKYNNKAFAEKDENALAVLRALIRNKRLSSKILLGMTRDAIKHKQNTLIQEIMDRQDLSPEVLASLDELYGEKGKTPTIKNPEVDSLAQALMEEYVSKEDWALTLIHQKHASRKQLDWALRRWYEEKDIHQALDKIKNENDKKWWRALTLNKHEDLREAAIQNSALPADLLTELSRQARYEEVSLAAVAHPNFPQSSLKELPREKYELAAIHNPNLADIVTLKKIMTESRDDDQRDAAFDRWREIMFLQNIR